MSQSQRQPQRDVVLNQVMLASAGSGKTEQLSLRLVKLLTLGAKPEEIVALTFTRAAAQEFAARILRQLARGAADEAGAAKLSADMGLLAPRDRAFFARLLRDTLRDLHRLTLGTLDSFFARLVNTHPTEVGLSSSAPWTMEELEGDGARRAVLLEILGRASELELQEIGQQVRDLSLGRDAATPFADIEKRTKKLHDLLTLTDAGTRWGDVEAIWGTRPALFTVPSAEAVKAAHTTYRQWLEGADLSKFTEKQAEAFTKKFANHGKALASAHEVIPASAEINLTVNEMGAITQAAEGEDSGTTYSTKFVAMDAATCAAYRVLASNVLARLVELRINDSKALAGFLGKFEAAYARQVRAQGQLTFSDYVTLLLRAELARSTISYRLDCTVRHWLFDEFQDTSTRQWKVLEDNLEEAMQCEDGAQTAFFVGDLKQSLYGWRAGNPRLLGNIRDTMVERFKAYPDTERKLPASYRCSQPIIDLVNRLLGDVGPVGPFFSTEAATRWARFFTVHQTAKREHPEAGEALWVRLPKAKGGEDSNTAAHAMWIAQHIHDSKLLEPGTRRLKPGITCAVLVSKNEDAAYIAEVLRFLKVDAADESETPIAEDNPLTAGLVALVRAAAHPTDTLSRGLVEMSPTANAVLTRLGGWASALRQLAAIFQAEGAEGLVREISRGAGPTGPGNANDFLRKRMGQLLALAVSYDEKGGRDLEGFCQHLSGSSLRDTADPRAVQVLTVHRSKGLQYTCVYLPCLGPKAMTSLRPELPVVHSDADFNPEWIFSRPVDAVLDADRVRKVDAKGKVEKDEAGKDLLLPGPLAKEVEREKGDTGYEALCKLYVGITRAERRVVLLTTELSDNAQKDLRTEARHGQYTLTEFIEHILGPAPVPKPRKPRKVAKADAEPPDEPEAAEAPAVPQTMLSIGNSDWLKVVVSKEPNPPPPISVPDFSDNAVHRPPHRKPSDAAKKRQGRPWRPSQQVASGKAFGLLVHSLMQSLEWDVAAFEDELKAKTAGTENPMLIEAREQILTCLGSPAVRAALSEHDEGCLLWRERQAAVMIDSVFIPAVFDRVHVVPGVSATILDYKTNSGMTDEELREEYRGQMSLYREAVAKLANVPKDKVRCLLVHVRKGTVVEVEPEADGPEADGPEARN